MTSATTTAATPATPAKPATYRRRGAKRAALALVPSPSPSPSPSASEAHVADATATETPQEQEMAPTEAPEPALLASGASVHTVSLAEPHWRQHLHDEGYWRQRLERAQYGMEQLVGRATKAKVGLPVAKQVEIRDTAQENAIRALWQALQIEGRITSAEIEARISEVMLRYYEPVIEHLLRSQDDDLLLHGPDARAFGGNGGSALSDARARGAAARPRVPRSVGFAKQKESDDNGTDL